MVIAVIFAISIFAGLASSSGSVNSRLRNILVDGFGLSSFVLPIILFYSGLLVIGTIRWKYLNYRILSGLIILFIGLMGMFGESGAGIVGEFVRSKTASLISVPGAVFLYFAFSVFSIVLITGVGINDFVEKLQNIIELIGEKVFKISSSDDSVEVGEATDSSIKDDEVISLPDSSYESPVLEGKGIVYEDNNLSDIEKSDKSFELVSPPTGPVDDAVLSVGVSDGEGEEDDDDIKDQVVEEKTALSRLPFSNKVWEYPPHTILSDIPNKPADAGNISERAQAIEDTLRAFGVKANIADYHVGPAVTRYALNLAIGTKTSKIQSLSTDLALRIKSPSGSVRIEAPIPGTNLVGVEVPNYTPSSVSLKSVLESDELKKSKSKMIIALGHDVSGKPVIQDITKWPHALIAGATGTGKSVMLNAIIATLLFRCSPSECRFIMIDPKLVELSQYNGIPHLLTPVVTDIEQKAVSALAWAVAEMERRYKIFVDAGVRNLADYNIKSGFQAEPYIVIVVDEIADMMMVAASEVEKYIIRLAQKSRATGIHLILATQRPSVNILTGTIKANVPTRLAFKVASQIDSRVIIDQSGAETLIGRGDMLFVPPDDSKARRVQGALVLDNEISGLVDYLKNTGIQPDYKEEILEQKVVSASKGSGVVDGKLDPKLIEAVELVISDGKASASYLQRKLGLGYSKAARIIDDLEDAGIVSGARGSKPRDVLIASVDDALLRLQKESV